MDSNNDYRRYLVLASFSVVTMTNSWCWITWSPLEALVEEYWSVSAEAVNQLSTVFMLSYVLLGLPGLHALERLGLKKGLRLGAALTAAGAAVRFLGCSGGRTGFVLAYAGSLITACGQLFTLAIPPLLATSWFPAKERSLATGVGVVANQSGTAAGLGLTGLFVTDATRDLQRYLGVQTLVASIGVALVFSFVEDQPAEAPSEAAKRRGAANPVSESRGEGQAAETTFPKFVANVTTVLSSRDMFLVTVAYGLGVGVFYSIATFLSQLLPDWDSVDTSTLGLVIVAVGLLGSFFAGWWLDRSRKYQGINRFFYATATLSMGLWVLAVERGGYTFIYLIASAAGFTLTAIICAGFEHAVELTFPNDEGTTAGIMNISAQLFGCLMIWIGEEVLDKGGPFAVNTLMLGSMLLATFLVGVLVNNTNYMRDAAERSENRNLLQSAERATLSAGDANNI